MTDIKAAAEELLAARVAELEDLAESAWGIIANAGGGDWSQEQAEWEAAADRWRDRYHAVLAPAGRDGEKP